MTQNARLRFLEPDDPLWLSFITNLSEAAVFHHPAWLNCIAHSYHYRPFVAAIIDDNDIIVAGVPVIEIRNILGQKRWVSLPFTDHCSPLAINQPSMDGLIHQLTMATTRYPYADFEIRSSIHSDHEWHTTENFHHHVINLQAGFSTVTQAVSKMHMRNVRIAERSGLQVDWGKDIDHIDRFYELHLHTRRRLGVPVQPYKYFNHLRLDLCEKNLASILLILKNGQCLAAGVFLHWGKSMVYKYGASEKEAWSLKPNNLLFFEAIRWGCSNSYSLLDLGRTNPRNSGLRQFKSGWGAAEYQLAYSSTKKKKAFSFYSQLEQAVKPFIRVSPAWLCKALGSLYGYFG